MERDENEYVIVNPGFGKPKFSKTEITHILIAILVLGLAFFILYAKSGSKGIIGNLEWLGFEGAVAYIVLFAMSVILVVFSFLLHELGHKFMAQKYGMWSEFRMSVSGLAITLLTSLIGFLFAAPGAVMISGNVTQKSNGIISIAGPIVNIVLAIVGLIGCVAFNHSGIVLFFMLMMNLNIFLAFFNLLPIYPLDGSKILKWNLPVWVVVMGISLVLFVYTRMFMFPIYIG